MATLLQSRTGRMAAWTVIIITATEEARADILNSGKTRAGAMMWAKASRTAPMPQPHRTAKVVMARPMERTCSGRPAPTSRPMMMEAVAPSPKETTMQILSTLPATV